MRLYVSGPMRRFPFYNFPAFDKARDYLRKLGHSVISPADLDRAVGFDAMALPADTDWSTVPATFNLQSAMERDLEAVRECDGIVLLPGWQDSEGARRELAEAKCFGKAVLGLWDLDGELVALTKIDTGPLEGADHV